MNQLGKGQVVQFFYVVENIIGLLNKFLIACACGRTDDLRANFSAGIGGCQIIDKVSANTDNEAEDQAQQGNNMLLHIFTAIRISKRQAARHIIRSLLITIII